MPYLLNNCGRRIARIRTQHGYTQERLADALNIDRTHLSKIEAGKRTCSIDLFVQLSALLGKNLKGCDKSATKTAENVPIAP